MSKREAKTCFLFLLQDMQKKQWHKIHIEKREKRGKKKKKTLKKWEKEKTREKKPKVGLVVEKKVEKKVSFTLP